MPTLRHGSGTLYQRGKIWWCKYYVAGKSHYESTKTKDRSEARRYLQSRLGQVADGRFFGSAVERITVGTLLDGLLLDYSVHGRHSLYDVRIRVEKHLRPALGNARAHTLTTEKIRVYMEQRQHAGASNAQINREMAALKRAYNLALQSGKQIKKPHFPRLAEDNVRQGFFERDEFDRLLAYLPDYLQPVMEFAFYTGWRIRSEILPLSWDRVDLRHGTVRLYRGTTKSKEGRLIHLPQVLLALLEQQWDLHVRLWPECPYVFPRQGKRILAYYTAWRTARKKAGLPKIPHDFRRTAVRNLIRAGVPERVAMQISGHKTRAIFDRYHIVSEQDLVDAARKIDRLHEQSATVH